MTDVVKGFWGVKNTLAPEVIKIFGVIFPVNFIVRPDGSHRCCIFKLNLNNILGA
jgi:hypothetical protein